MKVNNALAAGNTVVLKPSPLTPLAGLGAGAPHRRAHRYPAGCGQCRHAVGRSRPPSCSPTDPRIDMISFTGSSAVGCEVMRAAGDAMKRLLLECGGKSASIVLDDTHVTDEMLRQMLFDCCSLHAGQACILHSRLLLPDSLHDDVVDRLVALAREVKVGDPTDPDGANGAADQRRRSASACRRTSTGRSTTERSWRPAAAARPVWMSASTSNRRFSPTSTRIRRSPKKKCSGRCCRCSATATTTTPSRSRTTRATGCPARCGAPMWTGPSGRPAHPHRPGRGQRLGPGDAPFGGFKLSGFGRESGGIGGLHQYMEVKAIGIPGVTGPLAGLHVVEFANEISGPYAAKLFVDLGAEVTKIEPPPAIRCADWGPFPGGSCRSRSVPVCSTTSTPASAAPPSIWPSRTTWRPPANSSRGAHVLVENFLPGTLEGLGLGPDALSRLNPNLVLLRISHFGQCGPWRDRRATPLTVQAASGWISARIRPPTGTGRRPHLRVRRGRLRRARRADRAAAAARRPGQGRSTSRSWRRCCRRCRIRC